MALFIVCSTEMTGNKVQGDGKGHEAKVVASFKEANHCFSLSGNNKVAHVIDCGYIFLLSLLSPLYFYFNIKYVLVVFRSLETVYHTLHCSLWSNKQLYPNCFNK